MSSTQFLQTHWTGVSQLKRRAGAGLAHLAASAILLAGVMAAVLRAWYPEPFDSIAGAWHLFQWIIGVQLLTGPLLTFVVVSAGKPRDVLWRDLTILGLLQCVALAYGLWTVSMARPVYLVHEVDRFQVITASDLAGMEIPTLRGDRPGLPLPVAGVRQPHSHAELLDAVSRALAGRDIAFRPDWWIPLDARHVAMMRKHGRAVQDIPLSTASLLQLQSFLVGKGLDPSGVLLVPVLGKGGQGAAIVRRDTGDIAGFVAMSI